MKRIRHPKYRSDIFPAAHFINFDLISFPKSSNGLIGKSHFLCVLKCCAVSLVESDIFLRIDNFFQCFKEKGGDFCNFMKF